MSTSSPLEANAYAVTFRLLGDAPAAHAAASVACSRLERGAVAPRPGADPAIPPHWLYSLTELSVEEAVGSPFVTLPTPVVHPAAGAGADGAPADGSPADPFAGLRAALRRRLANATSAERVAGSLVHLAGYPVDFAAEVLGCTPDQAASAAAVIAPPPGVGYRDLGDPSLTGVAVAGGRRRSSRVRRPHWTTIAAVAVVAAAVIAATQVTGPRPTLGPPIVEGGLAPTLTIDPPAPETPAPDTPAPDTPAPDTPAPDAPAADLPDDSAQRNAGPLTQATSE